jgi:hypothetical protein
MAIPSRVFIVIGAGILALLPMPARTAPDLYVNVGNSATSSDGTGGPSQKSTGDVTMPNPLVVTLTNQSSYSASGITVSATYGLLQAAAASSAGMGAPQNASGGGSFYQPTRACTTTSSR